MYLNFFLLSKYFHLPVQYFYSHFSSRPPSLANIILCPARHKPLICVHHTINQHHISSATQLYIVTQKLHISHQTLHYQAKYRLKVQTKFSSQNNTIFCSCLLTVSHHNRAVWCRGRSKQQRYRIRTVSCSYLLNAAVSNRNLNFKYQEIPDKLQYYTQKLLFSKNRVSGKTIVKMLGVKMRMVTS